ncbi:chloramphenicol phosphotransferase CPT [Streptomyces sp. WI04-05B]|uniref:chloramphenicol phosphotransferase CPT n=1 Tax=Streptomyces TaxID=1883 RepID=UPI0029AA5B56|nr:MULTISPECIES: chloramphenicol phosphotransferase CPT [unclassified Streptomyces]MDX2542422.1 chloramphenicol phosphotransferase CPT [Streptomyces sp. WI04-05B]MDX2582559.1 chloramphenicol phosphotransferase CPT [Streptomyces sp. WI04-05A]MDX3747971.1 chloramphenicol phosphotransferase CPT [Streptomyces sp. AK08-02]
MIILNGGSSSGKSEIVRCLQAELPEPWLAFGCDSFVDALPARMRESDAGIAITTDGEVSVGADFLALEAAWREGVVATVRAGARVVIDDVFLGGAASQQRWRKALGEGGALGEPAVLWVGVRCEPAVAARREIARGDRALGMAAAQADVVHEGVVYDLEVDTSHTESLLCARTIAAHRYRR